MVKLNRYKKLVHFGQNRQDLDMAERHRHHCHPFHRCLCWPHHIYKVLKYASFPFLQVELLFHWNSISIVIVFNILNKGIFTATQSPLALSPPKTNFFPSLSLTYLDMSQVLERIQLSFNANSFHVVNDILIMTFSLLLEIQVFLVFSWLEFSQEPSQLSLEVNSQQLFFKSEHLI